MAKQVSNLVANSLRSSALAAFDNVAAARFAKLDVRGLLFSNFATVSPKLLPVYAELYDIAQFVQTEEQTRALLSKIIGLYRKKGTPWAMKQALAVLGYPDVTLIEGGQDAVVFHDAEILHDGEYQHGGGNWATFRVVVHLHGRPGPTPDAEAALEFVINDFKPARCKMLGLSYD